MMSRKFHFLLGLLVLVGCQIEDENAPRPEDGYVRFFGELANYSAKDIEVVLDPSGETAIGLVVFGTVSDEAGNSDYFVLETDVDGNQIALGTFNFSELAGIDFDQDGTVTESDNQNGNEVASKITPLPDGSYAFIGTTTVSNTNLNIVDYSYMSMGVISDIVDGEVLFSSTAIIEAPVNDAIGRFDLSMQGNDIVRLEDGSFAIVGAQQVSRGGAIDFDHYFRKSSADFSTAEFTRVGGVPGAGEDDRFLRAFEKADGSFALVGDAFVPATGASATGTDQNVIFRNYTSNGVQNSPSFNYGLSDAEDPTLQLGDELTAVLSKRQGGFVLVGTSTVLSNQQKFGFSIVVGDNGSPQFSNLLKSEVSSNNQIQLFGLTQTSQNDYVVAGQYQNFVSGTESRSQEGLFLGLDQSGSVGGMETNFGLSTGDDAIADIVALPDGKLVACVNVDFGGGVQLISLIKLNDDGSIDD